MIPLKNHFKLLSSIIFYYVVMIAVFFYFLFFKDFLLFEVKIGFVVFMCLPTPAFFIHLNYFLVNRKTIFEINFENKTININKRIVLFTDIKMIKYYTSKINHDTTSYLLHGQYKYAEVFFNENQKVIISTLLISDLKEKLMKIAGDKIIYQFKFFPFTI